MECKYVWEQTTYKHSEELIDTLWNVNRLLKTHKDDVIGINRYIMECKCRKLQTASARQT